MSEFVDSLPDVFTLFGPIQSKRMFGGFGIYHDDLMFALVVDEVLYLKADSQSASAFEQLELPQFEYQRNSKTIKMSFYMAPEEIFDDADEAKLWAQRAFDAALRSAKPASGQGAR